MIFLLVFVFSCKTEPKPQETVNPAPAPPAEQVQPVTPAPAPASPPPAAEVQPAPQKQPAESAPPAAFNPASITKEQFLSTKADVNALIENLNKIIRARNFNAWRTYLSDSYFAEISSQAFLAGMTDDLYKRDQIVASNLGRDPKKVQKKILRTPKDYFDNVVVPSRSDDHLDDIAFISENRVKAYTKDSRGQRLVLYDLELINNNWKIIN